MTPEEKQMVERLRGAIYKLSKWSGVEMSELIEDGYLNEGDMA